MRLPAGWGIDTTWPGHCALLERGVRFRAMRRGALRQGPVVDRNVCNTKMRCYGPSSVARSADCMGHSMARESCSVCSVITHWYVLSRARAPPAKTHSSRHGAKKPPLQNPNGGSSRTGCARGPHAPHAGACMRAPAPATAAASSHAAPLFLSSPPFCARSLSCALRRTLHTRSSQLALLTACPADSFSASPADSLKACLGNSFRACPASAGRP